MDQARSVLMGNLAQSAKSARGRLAFSLEAVSRLTGLPLVSLMAVEHGEHDVDLDLNELVSLALFLGLTARGIPRSTLPGSN
jgi:hypothetical protein